MSVWEWNGPRGSYFSRSRPPLARSWGRPIDPSAAEERRAVLNLLRSNARPRSALPTLSSDRI